MNSRRTNLICLQVSHLFYYACVWSACCAQSTILSVHIHMGQALQIVHRLLHITLSGNFSTCKCVQYLLMLQVINAWETELKQHFLFFVTGIRRLPQPHTEVLRIELPFVAFDLKDHTIMLSRLPQVSYATLCSCTLWCAAVGELLMMMMMMLLCDVLSHTCKNLVELLTHLKTEA